jgi:hypothetical protein
MDSLFFKILEFVVNKKTYPLNEEDMFFLVK